jgi:5-methylcytosine-specific restriction enzyme A
MKFGPLQLKYFGADEGAYSPVTNTEATHDRGVTLTGEEKVLALKFFGTKIHRGSSRSNPEASIKTFRVFPSGEKLDLPLNYPKPLKQELRLYFREPFRPKTDDIFYIFRRDGELWIGFLPEPKWRSLGRVDDEDEEYIALTEEAEKGPVDPKRVTSLQYQRDPVLAVKRFQIAKHRCEVDAGHELFIGRATGNPFVEAHHLIGVSLHNQFPMHNLDCLENIYALCPWCHRAIHHAEPKTVTKLIDSLIVKRSAILGQLALSADDILRLYNCEEITE